LVLRAMGIDPTSQNTSPLSLKLAPLRYGVS
jgi:hypothetical protein